MKPVEAEYETAAAKKNSAHLAKAAPNETPVHFIIQVTLETDANGKQHCVPRNIPAVMNPGDTVTYASPDGTVTITFDKDSSKTATKPLHTSPYANASGTDIPTVQGGRAVTVRNVGDYFCHCAITVEETDPKTGKLMAENYSWADDPKSGGNSVVRNG